MKNNIPSFLAAAALIIIAAGTYAHSTLSVSATGHSGTACVFDAMPEITGEAAVVYDIKSKTVLFGKNIDAQLPLASLTKLATTYAASISLDPLSSITITDNALTPEGDSGFFKGEVWRVRDLVAFTLITSSNDGARALALAAGDDSLETFLERMNTLAQKAGARQTYFINETGLDISSTSAGAYGSAHDIALFLAYVYKENQDILASSAQAAGVYTSLSGTAHKAEHTSGVAGAFPGEIAVKTGFTDLAGGNLAVLVESLPGRPVAIVVLGASRTSRDSDVKALALAARETLKRATLCEEL